MPARTFQDAKQDSPTMVPSAYRSFPNPTYSVLYKYHTSVDPFVAHTAVAPSCSPFLSLRDHTSVSLLRSPPFFRFYSVLRISYSWMAVASGAIADRYRAAQTTSPFSTTTTAAAAATAAARRHCRCVNTAVAGVGGAPRRRLSTAPPSAATSPDTFMQGSNRLVFRPGARLLFA